jgi:hypothetical protein
MNVAMRRHQERLKVKDKRAPINSENWVEREVVLAEAIQRWSMDWSEGAKAFEQHLEANGFKIIRNRVVKKAPNNG